MRIHIVDIWPDRSEAQRILEAWTANENLRKHAYAVEAAMRVYANKLGADLFFGKHLANECRPIEKGNVLEDNVHLVLLGLSK